MKELFLEMFRGLLLGMCFVLFCFVIASLIRSVYAVDLSNSLSDSSHRKSDFFVPKFCKASQAVQKTSASVSATPTRLQSIYDGMTSQNKSAMANMWGESKTSRVNPITSFILVKLLKTQTVLGGNHHA